jgi:hypothetical protein
MFEFIILSVGYIFGAYLAYDFYTQFTRFWYGEKPLTTEEFKYKRKLITVTSFFGLVGMVFLDFCLAVKSVLKK